MVKMIIIMIVVGSLVNLELNLNRKIGVFFVSTRVVVPDRRDHI
jgi:hypothetical protein